MADRINPHLYCENHPLSRHTQHQWKKKKTVQGTEKMYLLDKILPVLRMTLFITLPNVLHAISDYFCKTVNGKPADNKFGVYGEKNRSNFPRNYKM